MTDQTPIREQLLNAIDFSFCQSLGFGTPEGLLAAYEASRTQAVDPAAPTVWVDGHPQLAAIAAAVWEQCGRSDGLTVDDPRNIAVAALAAVLPATTNHDTDTSGYASRAAEAELYVLLRKAGEPRNEAQALIDRHRDEVLHRAELRRVADETAATETQAAEDPARIDRLRPEFFEHASVESIDVQIQRAQRQQRDWGNRERTLGILRQARLTQKEHGELPAAGARQDGAQP